MGMYLVAPPVLMAVIAVVAGIVIAIASRLVRRADWLDEQAAREAEATAAEDASDGAAA